MTEMNPRTCIVTRQEKKTDDLIRFVAGPDGSVVPDLKAVLPGRGAWVSLDWSTVATAVKKNLFSRAFETKVTASEDLPDMVLMLLEDAVSGSLAIAKKAGAVVTGFSKVDAAIRNGEAALLIHGDDAADDGKRKLQSANSATVLLGGPETEILEGLPTRLLERALGNNSVVHVAVKSGGVAQGLKRNIERLNSYASSRKNEK